VILKDSSGQPLLCSNVSLTVDVNAGAALNGLETGGTRALNHWYYLWLIATESTVASVLEDAGLGDGAVPAGPDLTSATFSGYTYKALIGQLRLDATGSGELVQFVQHDREVWTTGQTVLVDAAPSNADDWEVLTGTPRTSFRAAVPPTARSCSGLIGAGNTADLVNAMLCGVMETGGLDNPLAPPSILGGAKLFNLPAMAVAYNSFGGAASFSNLPVRGAAGRNIQWKSRLTSLNVSLTITGYTF